MDRGEPIKNLVIETKEEDEEDEDEDDDEEEVRSGVCT